MVSWAIVFAKQALKDAQKLLDELNAKRNVFADSALALSESISQKGTEATGTIASEASAALSESARLTIFGFIASIIACFLPPTMNFLIGQRLLSKIVTINLFFFCCDS